MIGILKSAYKLVGIFPVFYRTFPTQEKQKFLFPFIDPFLLLPSSLFTFLPSLFYLSLTICVKGEIIQTLIIMHNYETMLAIILGNSNIYIRNPKLNFLTIISEIRKKRKFVKLFVSIRSTNFICHSF